MPNWLKKKFNANVPVPLNDTSIQSLRYAIVDTELTSLDHRTNRLLSIGAILMQGPSIQLGQQFYRVVNSPVSIPAETVVIHKLRSEDIREGEKLEPVLDDFSRFVGGAVLVGHFVRIDWKVLQKEMQAFSLRLDHPIVDTARVHHWLLRRRLYREDLHVHLDAIDLASVARFYHLEVGGAHHALADAFLTAQIWQRMLPLLKQCGIESLRKLLRIGLP